VAEYLSDWQPQRLNGIPGGQFYDPGHAGEKGHNHYGFKTKEQAAQVVAMLRARGVTVTEWAGDPNAVIGGHRDPGHKDGRSFDVPASQWSPDKADAAAEIKGMTQIENYVDDFLGEKGVPDSVRPYRTQKSADGSTPATVAASAAPAAPQTQTVEKQVVTDWKASASDANRSTDPSSQAYWQRQDMRIWAQANPQLAKQAMAKAGADAAWLSAPATETVKETITAPAAPTAAAPTAAPKPENRGALGGTQVGGKPPASLQPYAFEIHADRSKESGGQTGLIGSYLDADNPLFQKIAGAYGTYGANNSRQWRGGDLGAPRRGLSIIETRTAGEGMNDPKQHEAAAAKLYGTLMADPDVKSGKRPLQFFAGHLDVKPGGEMGAACAVH
jgi:hypothetical protein